MDTMISKAQLIERLRALRQTIEREQEKGLTSEQACLLADICDIALNLSDEETYAVIGDEFLQIRQGRELFTQIDVPAFVLQDGKGPADLEGFRGFIDLVRRQQS